MNLFSMHLVPVILAQLIISVPNSAQNLNRGNATDLMALLDFKNRITDDPFKIMAS